MGKDIFDDSPTEDTDESVISTMNFGRSTPASSTPPAASPPPPSASQAEHATEDPTPVTSEKQATVQDLDRESGLEYFRWCAESARKMSEDPKLHPEDREYYRKQADRYDRALRGAPDMARRLEQIEREIDAFLTGPTPRGG